MPNQKLLDYIKESKKTGQSDEQIKSALLANDWQEADIDKALVQDKSFLNTISKKLNRTTIIISLIILGLAAFGTYAAYYKYKIEKPSVTPSPTLTATSSTTQAPSTPIPVATTEPTDSQLALVYGTVNKNEIGGRNLQVLSVYGTSTVAIDDSFMVKVSTLGPQEIFLMDEDQKVRATAISVPQSNGLIFDVSSTAKAALFLTPSDKLPSTAVSEAQARLDKLESLKCFSPFTAYLRGKLPNATLDDLVQNDETYYSLLMECVSEITGTKIPSGIFP